MANLPETEDFADGTYQIETSDRVLGGPGGIANKQAGQLGNRTAWLKAAIAKVIGGATTVGKAAQLATARTLKFKGAVSGTGSFDGTADTEITLTLADSGASAGSYTKVTINAKGVVTGASNPTTISEYGIADAFTKPETTSAIQQAISSLVASSPAALDTLKELAEALGNDPNFATTVTNALAGKAAKATTLGGYGITDAFTKPEVTSAIQQAIESLVASSPAALDTLKELADALGNDPNFATSITNALASKASKATTLAGYGIANAYTKDEITPLVAQATEIKQGTAKVGTQTQINVGDDDAVFVTPKKLRAGFSIMAGPAGYIAFPCWLGGFIFLWNTGIATSAEGAQQITYPVSLTESVWIHYVSTHIEVDNTGANGSFQTVGAPGLSSCHVFMQGLNTMGYPISPKLFLLGK